MLVQPLVSVLVPLYNHDKYIIKCMESILEEDYPNKEIIVIDDGSTDSSLKKLQEWSGKLDTTIPIKIIHRENKGVTKTLNELISISHGEFICLLSSDDFILPGTIQKCLNYLSSNPSKLAVFADCVVVNKDDEIIYDSCISGVYKGNKKCLENDVLRSYELIFNWCVGGPSFFTNKKIYDVFGGYDTELSVEDWDFYLRILSKEALGFIDISFGAYRFHGENTCRDPKLSLSLHESQYKTIVKNIDKYTGLKKAHLFALKLLVMGEIYKIKKQKANAYFFRRVGRIFRKITRLLYRWKVKMTLNLNYF